MKNPSAESPCGIYHEYFVEYLDGRAGSLQQRIDGHVKGCSACRKFCDFLRDVENRARDGASPARYSLQFKLDSVIEEAERVTASRRFKGHRPGLKLTVSVIGLVIGAGLLPTVDTIIEAARQITGVHLLMAYLVIVAVLLIASPIIVSGDDL